MAYPVTRVRARVMVAFTLLGFVSVAAWRDGPNPFVLTQWQFDWSDGVVRRGLGGTLFHALGGRTDDEVAAVALVLYLVAVPVVAWAIAWCVVDERGLSMLRLAVLTTWAVSPAGFPFLAANLGKFDTPTVLLAIGAAAAVHRWPRGVGPVVAVVALAVAVGLHEAAFLLAGAFVAALAARSAERGSGRSWHAARSAALVLGPLLLLVAAVGLHQPDVTAAELEAQYADQTALVAPMAVRIPFRSLGDNVRVVSEWMREHDGAAALTADLVSVVPVVIACVIGLQATRRRLRDLSGSDRALLASAFAPLLLVPIGSDFGRWTSFVAMLLSFGTALVLRDSKTRPEPPVGPVAVAGVVALAFTVVGGGTTSHAFWYV